MVTYELKQMRRVSITKNDSTTNLVSREKIVLEGMRRIFETTLEPSHGFRPNSPWYGKNGMERKKNDSMRRRESSIDRSILAYFDLERNDSLVWEPPFPHYSSPLKRAIENLDNLNKNAEVSVSQSSPLSPFFSQHHFEPWMGQSHKFDK